MNTPCCLSAARRARRSAPWMAPTAVLLLVPKCPMCLAAYVAAATGVSISLSAAGWLRTAMIGGSLAALLVLTLSLMRRCWKRNTCTPACRGSS